MSWSVLAVALNISSYCRQRSIMCSTSREIVRPLFFAALGFADLEPTRVGLIVRDCTWHEKNGKEWVAFPARPYETKNGTTAWQPLVEFAEGATEARKQFQQSAVAAIHQFVDEQNAEAMS